MRIFVDSEKSEVYEALEDYPLERISREDLLHRVLRENPEVIILDDGEDVPQILKEVEDEGVSVIVITENKNISHSIELAGQGAFDVIIYPFHRDELVMSVKKALGRFAPREKALGGIYLVGESEPMQRLWKQIRQVSRTDTTVLIQGESGSGKELVARAIHLLSERRKGPFLTLNCAAIPEELIESELFGHEKGAFTGAVDRKIGKFEAASGGILFLDEIGEMSLKTQAKLLRAIESGEITRVGSTKPIYVDVRIIAATNKNLEELVKDKLFRQDLYYRIGVVVIKVPPLRKRKSDIPLLVEYFMERFSKENNYPPKKISPRAMEFLKAYSWPGNVRELKNLVARLMTMVEEPEIDVKHLPNYIIVEVDEEKSAVFAARTLKDFKERAEKLFLLQKLKENNWNIKKTAEVLNTPRSNLYRKLLQYGIVKKDQAKGEG